MSRDRRPSRPPEYQRGRDYDTRRREPAQESGRPSSRYYDEFERPRSSRSQEGRAPAARPPGNRPPSNRTPNQNRPPVRRPVKRRRRRAPVFPILFLLACVVILILLVKACGGKETPPAGSYSLEFIPSQSLIVGDSGEVRVVGLPEDFSGSIRWTSNDSSILSISDGIMKAKSPGEATVTAIINDVTYSNTVMVYPVPENIQSITLNHAASTILSGKTLQMEAAIVLEDGTEPPSLPINWSSTNVAVASVTADGLVTARDVGTAAITAKLGNQSAVCVITVQKNADGVPVDSGEAYGDPSRVVEGDHAAQAGGTAAEPPAAAPAQTPPAATTPAASTPGASSSSSGSQSTSGGGSASSLSLSQKLGNLSVGGSLTLDAAVSPSNTAVVWSSNNPSIATVSAEGVVTAIGVGDVIITASAGGLSSHCSIRVDTPLEINPQGEAGAASDGGQN